MTKYVGTLICNFTVPKKLEKGTKEYNDFVKVITNKEPLNDEEENAPVAQPG